MMRYMILSIAVMLGLFVNAQTAVPSPTRVESYAFQQGVDFKTKVFMRGFQDDNVEIAVHVRTSYVEGTTDVALLEIVHEDIILVSVGVLHANSTGYTFGEDWTDKGKIQFHKRGDRFLFGKPGLSTNYLNNEL